MNHQKQEVSSQNCFHNDSAAHKLVLHKMDVAEGQMVRILIIHVCKRKNN